MKWSQQQTISTFAKKPNNRHFIDVSVLVWKTCKWYKPCAKILFTECSNMTELGNCPQNPHHNQAKWSIYIAQRNKISWKLVCRSFPLFLDLKWNLRGVDKESTWKIYCVLSTVTKRGRIKQRGFWTMEHLLTQGMFICCELETHFSVKCGC